MKIIMLRKIINVFIIDSLIVVNIKWHFDVQPPHDETY